jgi:hypothetical protein
MAPLAVTLTLPRLRTGHISPKATVLVAMPMASSPPGLGETLSSALKYTGAPLVIAAAASKESMTAFGSSVSPAAIQLLPVLSAIQNQFDFWF